MMSGGMIIELVPQGTLIEEFAPEAAVSEEFSQQQSWHDRRERQTQDCHRRPEYLLEKPLRADFASCMLSG